MQIRLSQQKHRFPLGRRRSLLTLVAIAALLVAAHTLAPLQPNNISAAVLLFLPLVLFAALGARREFLTPSLRELAFYFFAMVAAMAIWPSAHLAAFAYETTGFFVTLLVFMGFVFTLAIALGVVAVKLLSDRDSETSFSPTFRSSSGGNLPSIQVPTPEMGGLLSTASSQPRRR